MNQLYDEVIAIQAGLPRDPIWPQSQLDPSTGDPSAAVFRREGNTGLSGSSGSSFASGTRRACDICSRYWPLPANSFTFSISRQKPTGRQSERARMSASRYVLACGGSSSLIQRWRHIW
ncbi:MAG: hypothetical protein QOJ06_2430 [Pseudonocardiales bacterium]|nr:hypothetical protein [Pseudonocardiales bacterium]